MKTDFGKPCPLLTTQRLLQGKWSIVVMYHLSEGPVRFNELLRRMPYMTHSTLSTQLKYLEKNGLVIRKEYPQIPPKVEYSLSEIGEKFKIVLESIKEWGSEYIAMMEK